jgi:hypothetical protein
MTLNELIAKLQRAGEMAGLDCQVEFARGGETLLDASEKHSIDEVVLVTGMEPGGYSSGHPTLIYLVQT